MSPSVSLALYNASLNTTFLWLDDVFITGILAEKVHLEHIKLNDYYANKDKSFFESQFKDSLKGKDSTRKMFLHAKNIQELELFNFWSKINLSQRFV